MDAILYSANPFNTTRFVWTTPNNYPVSHSWGRIVFIESGARTLDAPDDCRMLHTICFSVWYKVMSPTGASSVRGLVHGLPLVLSCRIQHRSVLNRAKRESTVYFSSSRPGHHGRHFKDTITGCNSIREIILFYLRISLVLVPMSIVGISLVWVSDRFVWKTKMQSESFISSRRKTTIFTSGQNHELYQLE